MTPTDRETGESEGGGFSSLSHLRTLPIDSLKIDRSFITDLRPSGPERTIVEAVVTMARSLDLRVVAEGVETAEQQQILTQLRCDEMQGFVFSRPILRDDVPAFLGRMT